MNKRIKILIVLMSIVLVGIIVTQLLWIENAVTVQEKQFDQNVNEALNRVNNQIENRDALVFVSNNIGKNYSFKINKNHRSSFKYSFSTDDSDKFDKMVKQASKKLNKIAGCDSMVIDTEHIIKDCDVDTSVIKITSTITNDSSGIHVVDHKRNKLTHIINQMVLEYKTVDIPVEQRLEKSKLEEILDREFHNQNIFSSYQYGVVYDKKDSVTSIKSPLFNTKNPDTKYSISIFPEDIISKSYSLRITFPDKRSEIVKSMLWLMIGSLVFTIALLIIFSSAVYIILRQKKVSDIKSDFINNMTHEFKTPIATISLAVDSLQNPKIVGNTERMQFFLEKIKEENKRMNSQVENVLQMALLDSKDFLIHKNETDIHDLLKKAIRNITIQVEKKNGKIIQDLKAENSVANVDEVHFTNVIFNLLDNANKYSESKPEITVSTFNTAGGITISVEDKGIGMTKEQQCKAFEKFYRAATGNIHNVKGFGLGLSYSKLIVLAHGGRIDVISESGQGSRFDIFIPKEET